MGSLRGSAAAPEESIGIENNNMKNKVPNENARFILCNTEWLL
jgi:hypothetical protein